MNIAGIFFKHSASVETFGGTGANGDIYAAPVAVKGHLDDGQQLTSEATGETLVSPAKFYCRIEYVDLFTPESRVTMNGHTGYVTRIRRRDASAFGGPTHLEVDLR